MYDVSNSDTPAMSQFIDESSGLNSTFVLQNCTDFNFLNVGVVKDVPTGDSEQGLQALTRIFTAINSAYKGNNDGKELEMVEFDNEESLNTYVRNADYAKEGLCFAIGWNMFEPATA
jgi:hypothetical protein